METKNIKLVAYLRMKGIFPDDIIKVSRGKARYFFKMDADKWNALHQEFDRSPFIVYAQCVDAVTDLAY